MKTLITYYIRLSQKNASKEIIFSFQPLSVTVCYPHPISQSSKTKKKTLKQLRGISLAGARTVIFRIEQFGR